jgi:hypothetical protein
MQAGIHRVAILCSHANAAQPRLFAAPKRRRAFSTQCHISIPASQNVVVTIGNGHVQDVDALSAIITMQIPSSPLSRPPE